jgi:hypothetical protein
MKKKIILLSASLLVLAACTGADRPACWKANTKNDSTCNSSNGGGFSISKPDMKDKIGKRDKNNDVTTPAAPDTGNEDTPAPDTNDNPSPPEEDTNHDDNQETTPNQLNSNDVEGFDPFGGLYGPGT